MAVTVHIDQSAINRAFADMAPSAALHKTAIRKAGVALSLMIQQTLRQQGKDYYDAAADATSMEETAEGVSVSIAWRGIGLHWIGTQATWAARCGPPDALRKSPASRFRTSPSPPSTRHEGMEGPEAFTAQASAKRTCNSSPPKMEDGMEM